RQREEHVANARRRQIDGREARRCADIRQVNRNLDSVARGCCEKLRKVTPCVSVDRAWLADIPSMQRVRRVFEVGPCIAARRYNGDPCRTRVCRIPVGLAREDMKGGRAALSCGVVGEVPDALADCLARSVGDVSEGSLAQPTYVRADPGLPRLEEDSV